MAEHGFKILHVYWRTSPTRSAYKERTLKYPYGEWVAPRRNCGPLALFEKLELALIFAKLAWDMPIGLFHCEYENSVEPRMYIKGRAFGVDFTEWEPVAPPIGTVLADRVKCLDLIP